MPAARRLIPRAALGLLLALALAPRCYHLSRYVIRSDEGVYLESLLLMQRGFLPFRDFFSSQGPLFLPLLYPFSLLGGVLGPRLGVVLCSCLALLAIAALGRHLSGPPAGLAAMALLGLGPNVLYNSRLALAEIPAVAIAALAVWLGTRAPGRGRLVAAAAVLSAALLVKPLAAGAGLAILAPLLARRGRNRAWGALAVDLACMSVGAAAVVAVAALPLGPASVADQFFGFHADVTHIEQRGRLVGGWDNLDQAWPQLLQEGVGLYLLAAVGLVLAVTSRRALGWGVALWLLGTAGLLWAYVPFYDRYLVFLLVPLSLLAGLSAAQPLAWIARLLAPRTLSLDSDTATTRRVPPLPRFILTLAGALALLVYLAGLPALIATDVAIADAPWEPARILEFRAASDLAAITAPDAFVATDNQSIAFMAGRAVPPPLVDTSEARVTSESLDANDVTRALERFRVDALVWWSDDRFGKLKHLRQPLEQRFEVLRQYDDGRALYVRRGAPAAAGTPPTADAPE